MKKLTQTLAATAVSLASTQVLAHPGDHSEGGVFSSLMHFLTEPDHMMFIGITGFLACISYRVYNKVKASRSR